MSYQQAVRRRDLAKLIALCALILVSGCSRSFYRQQADADAYFLVDQKATTACAPADEYRIEIDPRSRMYDPYDPDVEPMPPDDPRSHIYMECVDCKKGSKCWRHLPETCFVDNPTWQAYLPRDAMGDVVVDMNGALDLALLNSPDYQENLENLYLSALDVSFERFRFDAQFFGGTSVFLTADGRDRAGGNASSVLDVSPARPGNRWQVRRLTATGGEIVAGFANSLIWQFAGPNDYTSSTLFDFAIVQPLLRAGGRTRVMERLTLSERTLLANVRAMERYRRGFYLEVVTGSNAGQGPSRRGGFFGGAGLEGFSGIGGGGFGGVGNFGGGGFFGGGQGGGFTGGAGAQGAGGYMGLLQSMQQIRNQRANVAALRESVEQLQASYDAGRIDRFQVDITQQALYTAQSQLLTSETVYQATLDNYKVQLGLPPELEIRIEDPLLDQFNLLDPELEALQERVSDALVQLRELRQTLANDQEDVPAEPPPPGETGDVGELLEGDVTAQLQRIRQTIGPLQQLVEERIAAVDEDFVELKEALPRRRELLQKLAQRPETLQAEIDPRLFDVKTIDVRVDQRRAELASLKEQLQAVWQPVERLASSEDFSDLELINAMLDTLAPLSSRLLELTLVQAAVRLEAIAFEPVELAPAEALVIASAYRRDWQNARAQLVDTWRLIYFNANDLLSDLDIVFSGDIGNLGDNPFRIRDTTGRLRVGVQFDAPLTRLAERNVYRQSLIEYQQARRSYYQFRDGVYQGLRNTLRQIALNEINFELRRAAVLVAIAQVDNTQLRLYEPPQPGAEAQFSNTTARDLVQSLADLLNVQNDFLSVWVNYEVQRLNLDFDLGIMALDEDGRRIEQDVPLKAWYERAVQQGAAICRPSDLVPGTGLLNTLPPIEEPGAEEVPVPLPETEDAEVVDPPLLPELPSPPSGPGLGLTTSQIDAALSEANGGGARILGPDGTVPGEPTDAPVDASDVGAAAGSPPTSPGENE